MLTAALWTAGAAIAAGLVLATWVLQDRPIRGAARWGAHAHGLLGAAATALTLALLARPDPTGFAHLAAYAFALALLIAAVILAALLRRRRPSGLAVALHATIGTAAGVMLLAYASI